MADVDALMRRAPVIPVIVIDRLEDAVPMAEALVAGGLPLLEVTLRTPVALDAIRAMAKVPGAIVGAGTVLNKKLLHKAQDAGATFAVSPGLTKELAHAAEKADIALLPGVATPADIMRGLDLGLERFKFFPAEPLGGLKTLKAFAAVFRDVRFCPTGGITLDKAREYLAEPSVLCVGGSWMAPAAPLDPEAIKAAAQAAAALRPQA